MSNIFPRWSLEKWQAADEPKAERFLREQTVQLIKEHQPPDDREELLAKGEAFIRSTASGLSER